MIALDRVLRALKPATVDQTLHDPLRELIHNTTAILGRYVGRRLLKPMPTVENHMGGKQVILLFDDPTPDTAIVVKTRYSNLTPWTDAITAVEGEDYERDGRRMIALGVWPRGFAAVQVAYTVGFKEGEGPEELQALALEMVVEAWRRNVAAASTFVAGDATGIKREVIGDYTVEFFDGSTFDTGAVELASKGHWTNLAASWRRCRC